ncbi:CDP-6-deoxy-delta-3,4-glucoseen reductase [Thiofilum flexile]|uniref:CDP-6-deoxy-delta-3,4-glucoseen reductase n=1 Tax=Thiofilum flexile TaxID=125627 RepID=UPI0003747755|nr:CDP-6-deoxy-delta-3,4-glucoseen reductase [Thiofilum flexile]
MYTITLQPSELQFTVEENENILDAGLRQGIRLPYSCQGGTCGSCAATIIEGQVDYPSEPLGLAPYDQDRGVTFLCQAVALSDLVLLSPSVGTEQEIEVKTLPARVEKMRKLCHDVMELTLKLPASERLRYYAGQYIDILLSNNRRRSFSIANAPHEGQYLELHVRHVPGGYFTTHVFEQMQEKALLRIEGPLGQFYLHEVNRPLLMVGGGTGIAPLKAMLEDLRNRSLTPRIYLYWGVRSKEDLYIEVLLKDWAARFPNLIYIPVLSEPLPTDQWEGRTGWVHEAVLQDFADLSPFDVYLSGPPPMINAAKVAFTQKGAVPEQMYSDSFEYGTDTLRAMADKV